MRIAILGAGVIGLTYGFYLQAAGHKVTMVARGSNALKLIGQQLTMTDGATGEVAHYNPEIALVVPEAIELVLVAVQAAQLEPAVLSLLQMEGAFSIMTLANAPLGLSGLVAPGHVPAGHGRVVAAFPGMGGHFIGDRNIRYVRIADQPTTLGRTSLNNEAQLQSIQTVLKSAGFATSICDKMDDWLKTHAVFICGVGGAVIKAGGAVALADDRSAVSAMITSVDEGFTALSRHGVRILPFKLRLIFSHVPRFISVPIWVKLLHTASFTVGLEPHVQTAVQEMGTMAHDVQQLTMASPHGQPQLSATLQTLRQRMR